MPNSPTHLKFLRLLPCAACGDDSSLSSRDSHHLIGGRLMMGKRAGDHMAIPLCPKDHRPEFANSLHNFGDEETWFATKKINGVWLAGALWSISRAGGDFGAACGVIDLARY